MPLENKVHFFPLNLFLTVLVKVFPWVLTCDCLCNPPNILVYSLTLKVFLLVMPNIYLDLHQAWHITFNSTLNFYLLIRPKDLSLASNTDMCKIVLSIICHQTIAFFWFTSSCSGCSIVLDTQRPRQPPIFEPLLPSNPRNIFMLCTFTHNLFSFTPFLSEHSASSSDISHIGASRASLP